MNMEFDVENFPFKTEDFEMRNLLIYFLIAFGWTWLMWLPSILIGILNIESLMYWIHEVETSVLIIILAIFGILGTLGPFVGAFATTYLCEGKPGVKTLWKRFWNLEMGLKWFMICVLFWLIPFGFPYILTRLIDGISPELVWVSQPWIPLVWFFMNFTRSGGMSEEFGWRGYALPRFQAKWNALISSLILGVIWAVWHLPLWFILGDPHQGTSFLTFSFYLILVSIFYTWLFNNTKGNILGAVLFHAMANTIAQMIPLWGPNAGIYLFGVILIVVVLIIRIFGPKTLARRTSHAAR